MSKERKVLAVGLWAEPGCGLYTASRMVKDEMLATPQKVAEYLKEENKTEDVPDEILIIENDEECPSVVQHWNVCEAYTY